MINGRIGGIAKSHDHDGNSATFETLVLPDLLHSGANALRVYEGTGDELAPSLHEMPLQRPSN